MDTPSGGGRDSRFSMGYNISLLSGETAQEIYNNAVHSRPSTSITSGLSRGSMSLSSSCGAGMQRGMKRTSSDVCYEQDGRQNMGLSGDCGSDIVDDGFSPTPQKGSPPSNGKKTKGRVKIKMEYIDNKLRRYTTFSKRKTGIMKKAYELSTLTGTQVMLLVASETGHVYTFATRKLQPMITSEAGKALIQTCLNSPDPCPSSSGGDQRMSATGFEETELSYNIGEEEQKETRPGSPAGSEAGSPADSTSSESPNSPGMPNHQSSVASTSSGYPGGMYGGRQGMVYASPSPGLPNGGVILSVGGGPPYITIPLPLGLSAPTDLSSKQPK
ncbi:serum response factor homolog isoform X5 [Halyomorpha halys]|uniref:serum response factor homolog isoform X5 n=1 Tax=Halyomorpha halys TaxID=286706 RepID=UPI0034D2D604